MLSKSLYLRHSNVNSINGMYEGQTWRHFPTAVFPPKAVGLLWSAGGSVKDGVATL